MNASLPPGPASKRWPLIALAALLVLMLVGGLLAARQRAVPAPAAMPGAAPGHQASETSTPVADADCEEEPPPESFALPECDGGDAAPDAGGENAP